eukprot:m51a1_g12533 hypothetical protein (86) ;mRNA; r:39-360
MAQPQHMTPVTYDPIGVLRTPWQTPEGMPAGCLSVRGTALLRPDVAPGLADLESFTHAVLVFHFHAAAAGYALSPTASASRSCGC